MIIDLKPISLVEAEEIIESVEEKEDKKEIKTFIKKFNQTNLKDAKSLRADLESLDMLKMKTDHIVKIIDILPEDEADLSKIFIDSNLTNDEATKILELVKKYK